MLIPTYDPVIGGAQTQVRILSRGLRERGWDVRILTRRHLPGVGRLQADSVLDATPVHRCWSRGGRLGGLAFIISALFFLARKAGPAVYHAHDVGTAGWLAVAARTLFGGRAVIKLRTGRQGYEDYLSHWGNRLHFVALLRRADIVHVVNREVVAYIEALASQALPVRLLSNGVDTAHYRPPDHAERGEARARLDIDDDCLVFLFLGRLQRLKGLDVLLEAWRRFSAAAPEKTLLLVVGDGPDRPRLEPNSEASLRFAGSQKDAFPYLRAADVFVLPSRTEGLSNSLVEAMACGLPVIASAVGGAPDWLDGGPGQRLFQSEDSARLSELLAEIAGAAQTRRDGGRRSRQRVVEGLSLSAALGEFEQLYQELSDARAESEARQSS